MKTLMKIYRVAKRNSIDDLYLLPLKALINLWS